MNVGGVVDDLAAATAFFVELGMEVESEASVEGRGADRVVGLDDVRVDITMMRTPDGHGKLEPMKFHTPMALQAEPEMAPANTLASVGGELVGELAQYEDIYRLCYVRGPEGIIIALAE